MGHESSEFEEAVRSTGDLGRRLEGEDPETNYVEDARHWEGVYRELHSFKRAVLQTARARGLAVGDEGRGEVENDLVILAAEEARLEARLQFWQSRRAQLEREAG